MRKKRRKNQLCAICGKPIAGNSSKEHVFPRAIIKWNEEYIEPKELLDLTYTIESKDNIVKTHPKCNYNKSDAILELDDLYLIEEERNGLLSVQEEIWPFLNSFIQLKSEIIQSQGNRCFVCNCELDENATLRRVNKTKPRLVSNAAIVCPKCNQITDLSVLPPERL